MSLAEDAQALKVKIEGFFTKGEGDLSSLMADIHTHVQLVTAEVSTFEGRIKILEARVGIK